MCAPNVLLRNVYKVGKYMQLIFTCAKGMEGVRDLEANPHWLRIMKSFE